MKRSRRGWCKRDKACVERMNGTEEEVEMGTKDFNRLQINEWCRNSRSGQLSACAGSARPNAPDSELFTILDLGDLPHPRRASRTSADCCPHRRRSGLDGSDRDGFSNENGMTRHQELECTDKTVGCWRDRKLENHQFWHRLQHPQQLLRVPICNATGASVECTGQKQAGHRFENDCDVGRRKCDKPDHLRWDSRRCEHRGEAWQEREKRAVSGEEAQHSSSDQGDSIVRSTNVYSSPGGECGHTRTKYNILKDVPMDALRRRRGMYCTQWKVDDSESQDDEVTRANHGRRQSGCYRKELPTLQTRVAGERSLLYCAGCTGTTKSDALGPVICSITRNSIVVAQATAHRLLFANPLRLAMMRSGGRCSAKQVHMTWTEDTTMNEDKQCLQPDVTEVDVSRRGAGRTRLMFVWTYVV